MAITLQDYRMIFHRVGTQEVCFEAANQDTTDSTYNYFGYISADGAWIIQRFHIIGSTIQCEYIAGQTRAVYDTYWITATGRYQNGTPLLTYTTFDLINSYLL